MKLAGTATYRRYVKREDDTTFVPVNGMMLPITSDDDEQRIAFTLDDGTVLDFSAETDEPDNSGSYMMGVVAIILLALYVIVPCANGAIDALHPQSEGTSIVAKFEQNSPPYVLFHWLFAPRDPQP
jgi:hypothetical protein